MKSILLLVASLALAIAEPVFDKCPAELQNLPDVKAINGRQVLGLWYTIRKGPIPASLESKIGKVDCMNSVSWRETDSPPNVVNHLFHARKDGKHIVKTVPVTVVPTDEEGMFENNFMFTKAILLPGSEEAKEVSIQEKLVETDDGKSWSLWVACINKEGGNSTIVWTIKSRCPALDAGVDQMLVEKVEKYGGVGPTQLRGIGQLNCY